MMLRMIVWPVGCALALACYGSFGDARADALDFVDPMVGTEGVGTRSCGLMPYVGVPFGSMHLVPMTRWSYVRYTSFDSQDGLLRGFNLTRQPAIWMGEWGATRVFFPEPKKIERIDAKPYLTVVKAGGRTYELTASSHVAYFRTDDARLGDGLPDVGWTSERTERTSIRTLRNFRSWYVKRRCGNVLKIAVSLISEEDARRNLAEELPEDFDAAVRKVRGDWKRYFDRVSIDAPNEVKRIFYTALFHTLLYPRDTTERGRYYSAFDDRVHEGVGYNCYSLWDTYRAEHPLLTLFAPERVDGMMQSLVNAFREGGWLPLWPNLGYTGEMIGGPAEVVLAEAYVKGFRGFDAAGAWEAVLKNATVPQEGDETNRWLFAQGTDFPPETRGGLSRYMKCGFVSQDETDESVSRTIDFSYDDAAVAAFAAALGRREDAERFHLRSRSYTNLWNAAERRFWPRHIDGRWIRPAKNIWAYTETDPATARWCVPHDVDGLVSLMGGKDEFVRELDLFFDIGFYREDAVGNKSVHGNETGHHVAYLYNRVGEYAKTCRRVRDILTRCYSTGMKCFDGNDDCGQMSAWYVLSALGFYPLDPASGEYELGSPLIRSALLRFGSPYLGAELRIVVRGYAPGRWLVKRVLLNGRELTNRRIRHADLVAGGELVFEMDDQTGE